MSQQTAGNGNPRNPRPRRAIRPFWWGLGVAAAVGLAVVVYWWPGRGGLTYLGFHIPSLLDVVGPSRYRLTLPRLDVPGVPNFAQVSPGLCRGAQPTAEGFAELKHRGIRTILSLRDLHDDRELLAGLGLRYVRLDFNATEPNDDLIASIMQVIADPANQPVFVHCQAGADRTGTVVAVYRVVFQDWPVEEAAKELPLFGFHEVWTDLLRYLATLDEAAIRQKMAANPSPRVEVVP